MCTISFNRCSLVLLARLELLHLFNDLLGLFACELKYLQIYAIYPILYLFTMLNNVYMSIIVHPNKLVLIICVIICMQKTVIKLRHNNSPRIRRKQICQRVCVRERWDGGGGGGGVSRFSSPSSHRVHYWVEPFSL